MQLHIRSYVYNLSQFAASMGKNRFLPQTRITIMMLLKKVKSSILKVINTRKRQA